MAVSLNLVKPSLVIGTKGHNLLLQREMKILLVKHLSEEKDMLYVIFQVIASNDIWIQLLTV